MTMVDNLLAERGATAKGRPPDEPNTAGYAPGKRIPRFGESTEQMEQDGGSQTNNDQSSNMYTCNSPNRSETYSPEASSLLRASNRGSSTGHDRNLDSGQHTQSGNHAPGEHLEPPNPPNLTSRHRGQPFGVSPTDVGYKELIKLLIEFPLRQGNSGNDVALFFKHFITVLFAANREILLTKWTPGDENPISKAIDIVYSEESIGEYYFGMKTLHDKRRIIGFTRILSSEKF